MNRNSPKPSTKTAILTRAQHGRSEARLIVKIRKLSSALRMCRGEFTRQRDTYEHVANAPILNNLVAEIDAALHFKPGS